MKNIFEFSDYKSYLIEIAKIESQFRKGFRTRLATAAGCNNTFISQVLNSGAHFSLEQGLAIARFLELKTAEEKYLLCLIEHARAGTKDLREYFQQQIEEFKQTHLNIKNRVLHQEVQNKEWQNQYYSQWFYIAIHMAITIKSMREIGKIANALSLKPKLVENVILFLLTAGLINSKNGELIPGPSYLHLEQGSALIPKHHTNWRIKAIQSLEFSDNFDVHYSSVSTLSQKDADELKSRTIEFIQNFVKQVAASSNEEVMVSFNLDFFKLTK